MLHALASALLKAGSGADPIRAQEEVDSGGAKICPPLHALQAGTRATPHRVGHGFAPFTAQLEQMLALRDHHRLEPRVDAEPPEDGADVVADRLLCEPELSSDLAC